MCKLNLLRVIIDDLEKSSCSLLIVDGTVLDTISPTAPPNNYYKSRYLQHHACTGYSISRVLANNASLKHLTFPTSEILTRSQRGITQVSTYNYSKGGIVL
jgi:hypothetical protein